MLSHWLTLQPQVLHQLEHIWDKILSSISKEVTLLSIQVYFITSTVDCRSINVFMMSNLSPILRWDHLYICSLGERKKSSFLIQLFDSSSISEICLCNGRICSPNPDIMTPKARTQTQFCIFGGDLTRNGMLKQQYVPSPCKTDLEKILMRIFKVLVI